MKTKFKLRFKEIDIPSLAKRYQYSQGGGGILAMQKRIRAAGFLTKGQLKDLCKWKAPRIAGHVDKNDRGFVEEVTAMALSERKERTRIEVLTVLNGVSWPVASCVLYFFHKEPYPILDYRALWSVSVEAPKQYTISHWWPYVEYCRILTRQNRVRMRTLDMALWQYSKERQRE